MKTITAKQLRDNLDEVVKRVRSGEPLRVTYRSKAAFILQPDQPAGTIEPGSVQAMKLFVLQVRELDSKPRPSVLDPHKPIKELYHQLLDADPKYKAKND